MKSITITNDEIRTLIELHSPYFNYKSIKIYRSNDMTISFSNNISNDNDDTICEIITHIRGDNFNMEFRFLNDYEDIELYKLLHSLRTKCFRVYMNFDRNKIELEDLCTLYESSWLNNGDTCPLFIFTYRHFCQDNKFKSLLYSLQDFDFKSKDFSIKLLLIN